MKRIFDLIVSLSVVIASLPILIIISLLVVIDLREFPIFIQRRIGKDEIEFKLFKFKTMVSKSPERVSNAERVSKLGRFLRSTSLDELPSLFNVIKGDMSIVGPRPLLVEYLAVYSDRHRIRHRVKPGLTGLAQVNGRNRTTWTERLDFDVRYVDCNSLWLDFTIIFLTIGKVITKDGAEGEIDMSIVRLDQDPSYESKRK